MGLVHGCYVMEGAEKAINVPLLTMMLRGDYAIPSSLMASKMGDGELPNDGKRELVTAKNNGSIYES